MNYFEEKMPNGTFVTYAKSEEGLWTIVISSGASLLAKNLITARNCVWRLYLLAHLDESKEEGDKRFLSYFRGH